MSRDFKKELRQIATDIEFHKDLIEQYRIQARQKGYAEWLATPLKERMDYIEWNHSFDFNHKSPQGFTDEITRLRKLYFEVAAEYEASLQIPVVGG